MRRSKPCPCTAGPLCEPLEARRVLAAEVVLLAGGTLRITGTEAADSIILESHGEPGFVVVTSGFIPTPFEGVKRIVADLKGGDDVIGGDLAPFIADIPITVRGGNGRDTIWGGPRADDLRGGNGDDEVHGGSANDSIKGGNGSDALFGGGGNDTVDGQKGADSAVGESGNDLVRGGDGPDIASGGAGRDTVLGGRGSDELFGGAGADTLTGEGGLDHLRGHGAEFTDFSPEDALWSHAISATPGPLTVPESFWAQYDRSMRIFNDGPSPETAALDALQSLVGTCGLSAESFRTAMAGLPEPQLEQFALDVEEIATDWGERYANSGSLTWSMLTDLTDDIGGVVPIAARTSFDGLIDCFEDSRQTVDVLLAEITAMAQSQGWRDPDPFLNALTNLFATE